MTSKFLVLRSHIISGTLKVSNNLQSIAPWEKISGVHRIPGGEADASKVKDRSPQADQGKMVFYEDIIKAAALADL